MLSHNKITIIDEVIRRTLFLVEDGKTKADLNTLLTTMKTMQLFGQVLGMVIAFHPSGGRARLDRVGAFSCRACMRPCICKRMGRPFSAFLCCRGI